MNGDTHHVYIPLGNKKFLTNNTLSKTNHWATRSTNAKAWRTAALKAAQEACLPTGLIYARIDAYIYKTRNNRYDPANLAPCLKAAIDGLIDYGLLPDDNWKHLDGPLPHHGGKDPHRPGILLIITETEPTYRA